VNPGDRAGGLLPLSRFAPGNHAEAAKLERLQGAWPLLVGPGLSRHTHPISIAGGLLLIGCHDTFALKSMRAGAQGAWPSLRARIDAMLGTRLQRVEITPSDPPARKAQGPQVPGAARTGQGPAGKGGETDPLDAVLELCRARAWPPRAGACGGPPGAV
jgi:hypothetical protein